MVTFRRWMALPMGLTMLALLWLASRLGGMTFSLALAASTVVLLGALAAIGRLQYAGRPVRLQAAIALLAAVGVIVGLPQTVRTPTSGASQGVLPAQPFSEAALAEARSTGKPVFVWFTADWCLTCKVNESVAIEREPVRKAFGKAGVAALKGDWTRRDPAITRFLTAQGAAGVPLYLWYPAGGGAPRQLPQVLAPDSLTQLVER